MKQRRVAIVSDVVMSVGGAEVVVERLMKMFPSADLFTLLITPGAKKKLNKDFPKVKIYTSIFQGLIRRDTVSKYISVIKFFSWLYWEFLDLSKYDLIISSSHSFMAKNVRKGIGAKHLAYIHTPPRYLYNEFNEISWLRNIPWKWLFWPFKEGLRYIDRNGASRPDVMLANSKNVAMRIERYYGRKAEVVYPPVEVEPIKSNVKKGNYYVCLSRLVKQKGIDLAVKTCTKRKIALTIIGNGGELENLKKLAGFTIKFLDDCDDREKFEILARAKALIYTSKNEDFGIVPVESLKMGTSVIAYNSGGVKETVFNGKNGVLFDEFDDSSLFKAIKIFEKMKISRDSCVKSVDKYSAKVFEKQIRSYVGE